VSLQLGHDAALGLPELALQLPQLVVLGHVVGVLRSLEGRDVLDYPQRDVYLAVLLLVVLLELAVRMLLPLYPGNDVPDFLVVDLLLAARGGVLALLLDLLEAFASGAYLSLDGALVEVVLIYIEGGVLSLNC